jgi:NAD+ synthase
MSDTEQLDIIKALDVVPHFDAQTEAERRIEFLCEQLRASARKALVLGISGGVDSTVAGRLAQLAVERYRQTSGQEARFIAVRLPYGVQKDEHDAQAALAFIKPDETLTVNIKQAADGTLEQLKKGGLGFKDDAQEDFVLGNIKARERMIVQYAIAGARDGLVVGTDHAAEALMGFFTKHGDGACDVAPLTGLNKRRVRAVGSYLGAAQAMVDKVPTADLESLRPGHADETALGVKYEHIDDFLEGKAIPEDARATILRIYNATQHKRALPIAP